MGKFTDEQIQKLSEELLIVVEILSEENNDFTILDFEAGFDLPYESVLAILRSPYYKNKLNLNREQKLLLSSFFKTRPSHHIKAKEEGVVRFAFNCVYKENDEIASVSPEDCLDVFHYLEENGIHVTYFGFDCALKRYAFGKEILPYFEKLSKDKDSRQTL